MNENQFSDVEMGRQKTANELRNRIREIEKK
jgi:hypothetical protein